MAAGDGAYLMEEVEQAPNVFTVAVGNIPPHTMVGWPSQSGLKRLRRLLSAEEAS